MTRAFQVWLKAGVVGVLLGLAAGCGLEDLQLDTGSGAGSSDDGPVCYSDEDCVPNDCCGEGWAAVHSSQAPDCGGVVCDGSCPSQYAECGCAIPYCRESRCQLAYECF
jgi:hypothetical protein